MSQKIKGIITQYGRLALITHVSLSLGFYTGIYFLLSKKYVNSDKLFTFFKVPIPENKNVKTGTDTFLAYVIYKGTMPIRIPFTIFTVTLLAKILKRI
jgi:hypothetical protein